MFFILLHCIQADSSLLIMNLISFGSFSPMMGYCGWGIGVCVCGGGGVGVQGKNYSGGWVGGGGGGGGGGGITTMEYQELHF